MRAPLSWIREFVPVDAPVADIADALNQLGLEVEAIEAPGRDIGDVVVARILEVMAHPDADRIRLADVDAGDGVVRVVCGAPNIEAGMVVPFAPVGAQLPGDFTIERRTIRGQISEGMLCSARELGLGDDHGGILELPRDAVPGTDIREVLGLDDVVFDLSITPNRPDAMGIVGVARELAAHYGLTLTVPTPDAGDTVRDLRGATVVVEARDRCPRFVAMVADVTVGESPDWMQRRLVLAGMRPINNVVDVTNYVMLERCRPLHAFDFDRLAGPGIVVRLAQPGEKIETLDGVRRELSGDDLLICDASRVAQGIAGVMGGSTAEVSPATTTILVESAYFEASGIAKTAKRLGLRSEASARFERGVDPNDVAAGAARAMELLTEIAAARRDTGTIDVYPQPIRPARVVVRTDRVNQLLATSLTDTQLGELLAPLGIDVADGTATVPTWRPDVEREIDIVEEVARRIGLHRIARTVPANADKIGALTAMQRDRRVISDVLVGAGYDEVFTLPLLAPTDLARAGVASDVGLIEVENPLRAEESILRPALLPGVLRAVAHNATHGNHDVSLFEIGHVFAPPVPGATLPVERLHLAAVRAGHIVRTPYEPDREVTVHDIVAVVEAVAQELRLADWNLVAASRPGFHPVRTARIMVDGADVGTVGEIDGDVIAAFALNGPVVAYEIDADLLLAASRVPLTAQPISRYPTSTIDLAFVVADDVPAGVVLTALRDAGGQLLESVRVFDVFRSETLGPGRVSLAFALTFRAPDRTLTDGEVGELRRRGIDAVTSAFGAELRG
ncbi:MAG TPA: phenylalanine--tRNA ligase subunit beta [Acidimicrobiia bacterium]|nr:phenylalanine--tRNA ligase subunit beta [Acidimicrobiia bacterium]